MTGSFLRLGEFAIALPGQRGVEIVVPLIWCLHVVDHSDLDLDVSSASCRHTGEVSCFRSRCPWIPFERAAGTDR